MNQINKMITQNNVLTSDVILNAYNLPKKYKITPDIYNIQIIELNILKITSKCGNKLSLQNEDNIKNLFSTIYYAQMGYTDCTMSLNKFNQLLAALSYNETNIKGFYIAPVNLNG